MKRLPLALLLVALAILTLSQRLRDQPVPPSSARAPAPELLGENGTPVPIQQFAEWLQDDGDLAEGRILAQQRRAKMLDLMREDPQRALEHSLRWHQWLALPSELQEMVEQPFSARGDYSVYSGCGEFGPKHLTWLTLNERADDHFKVHATSAWQNVPSKENLPVQGIRIGNEVALWPGVMQEIDAIDRAALTGRFPQRALSAEARITALVGGELVSMENSAVAQNLRGELQEALEMVGPDTVDAGIAVAYSSGNSNGQGVIGSASAASLAWSAAPKRVIILRLDFADLTGAPKTQADLETILDQSSDWLSDSSYGRTNLSTQTVTPQVLRLPKTSAQYQAIKDADGNWSTTLATDARAVAVTAGYDMSDYDIVVYSFKRRGGVAGGFANVGKRDHWASNADIRVYVHEFGHNYGLNHANFWVRHQAGGDWREIRGVQTSFGPAGNDEYGDAFDMMAVHSRERPGSDPVWPNGDFAPSGKVCLGWIDADRIHDVTTSGIYRVFRFDHPDAHGTPARSGDPLAVSIRLATGERIWAALRRNFPSNHTLSTGAYLVWAHSDRNHRQIDCTPFSQIDGITGNSFDNADFDRDDSALAEGNSWTSPDGSVTITNLGLGGTAPFEYLDLRVEVKAKPFGLFTDTSLETPGLTGRYFNETLRATNDLDWQTNHTPTGTRVDASINFTTAGWGDRGSLGLTGGTDDDWDNYSVQWDGVLSINGSGLLSLAMNSDDGSRMWIDADNDGTFELSEQLDNTFGQSGFTAPLGKGIYPIRIQYEELTGGNRIALSSQTIGTGDFELYQDANLTTDGLTASFSNSSLRPVTSQADWKTSQTISGTRAEAMPLYWDNQMGKRSTMGITGGSDSRWFNFSVQYDGWIKVLRRTRFLTYGADGSRFWIDTDGDGNFGTTAPEFHAATWGSAGAPRYSLFGEWVEPGTYRLRIQHEIFNDNDNVDGSEGESNRFAFMGQPAAAFSEGYGAEIESGGSVTAPSGTPISGTFTVEAWVKPDTTAGMPIFSTRTPTHDYGFTLKIRNGNEIFGHIGGNVSWVDSDASVMQDYRAGEWMHIAYVVTPFDYKIYLNGWLAKTEGLQITAPAALLTDSNHPVAIGIDPRFPSEQFIGQMDEVRVWDMERSGEQIAQTMRRSVRANTPGLASCWTFDNTLEDLTGNRHGTSQGAFELKALLSPVDACSVLEEIPAALTQTVDGSINFEGDSRWYCLHVREAGTFEAWTTGLTDTIGTLYGSGSSAFLVEIDDETSAQRNFRLLYDLSPGVYYLQVRGYNSNTGGYTLHTNAYVGIKPLDLDLSVGNAALSWDARKDGVFYLMETDDPARWQFHPSGPFTGRGAPMMHTLPSQDLEASRRFYRVVDAPGKGVFGAKLFINSSSLYSETQTPGFEFTAGPPNQGDAGLNVDGAPLSQSDGVTIANGNASFPLTIVQAPGDLSDSPPASFPNGTWIAANHPDGSEASGGGFVSMAHFPFANGWVGGHLAANGQQLKVANVSENFHTQVVEPGTVALWDSSGAIGPGLGALFVIATENLGTPNVMSTKLSFSPGDGDLGWRITNVESTAATDTPHAADWSFAYVPYDTEDIVVGRVGRDSTIFTSGPEPFTCTWDSAGEHYELGLPEVDDISNGILIVTGMDSRQCHLHWRFAVDGIDIMATELPLSANQDTQCGFVFAYVPFDRVALFPGGH